MLPVCKTVMTVDYETSTCIFNSKVFKITWQAKGVFKENGHIDAHQGPNQHHFSFSVLCILKPIQKPNMKRSVGQIDSAYCHLKTTDICETGCSDRINQIQVCSLKMNMRSYATITMCLHKLESAEQTTFFVIHDNCDIFMHTCHAK